MSGSCVDAGMKLAAEAIMGSMAPRTWAGYSASWRNWLSFASSSGYDGNRPMEGGLLAFVASLFSVVLRVYLLVRRISL